MSFGETQLTIQLTFETPIYVSADASKRDQLRIQVKDKEVFISKLSHKHLAEESLELKKSVPPQISLAKQEQIAEM